MDVLHDFRQLAQADRTRHDLEQAERLLACFQKALGHELPNQLVALQGLARLLEEEYGTEVGPEGRLLLKRLAALAQRADTLVRSLAEIGRLCRASADEGGVRLEEVIREAVAEIKWLGSGATIEYHFSEPLTVGSVSRRALHQVLVQLLCNAVQSADATRPLRIEVSGHSGTDGVEIRVADNGRGVSAAQEAQLFQPFAGAAGAQGCGLGLFLVRQLVARWAGAVRLQSEPDKGTVVTIRLPKDQGGSRKDESSPL